ncbi:24809_t:CDS:2, partial [Gigaspora rosea]
KSSNRLTTLNKSEVEKLFSFEATSPEVSDVEEMVSPSNDQDHRSESRKTLLVPVLPWMSDERNHIRNLADDVIKRTRVEKLNSGGHHSYATLCRVKLLKWMIKGGLICNR